MSKDVFISSITVEQALNRGYKRSETAEYDLAADLDLIKKTASKFNYNIINIGNDHELISNINRYQPEVVWNLNSGFGGISREANLPATLEMLNIRTIGANAWQCSLTQDKILTQRYLQPLEYKVLKFLPLITDLSVDNIHNNNFDEIIFKPRYEGSSLGIHKLYSKDITQEFIKKVTERYEYFAQEFIDGYDISMNFGVNNLGDLTPFKPLYTDSKGGIDTNEFKIEDGRTKNKVILPTDLATDFFNKSIVEDARVISKALKVDCYLRLDFRVKKDFSEVFFLEANATPTICPDDDYIISSENTNISYEELIKNIIEKRYFS